MNIFENLNMAVKTLTANKLRSALTMLGIIIGNGSVVALSAIGEGAKKFTQEQLETIGPNQLSIRAKPEENQQAYIFLPDVEAIATQATAVAGVAPQLESNLRLSYKQNNLAANVTGTTPGMLFVRNLRVRQGRFFNNREQTEQTQVAVLGAEVANKLFSRENPLGKVIQINNLIFSVIGVMQPKGSFLGANYDEAVYIPITTAAYNLIGRRSPRGIPLDYMELSAKDEESVRIAAFQVTNILTLRHGKKDFTISANKSVQDLVGKVTGGLSLVLATVGGISLLVGGIGIMNIMLVSVTERTKEIGLRKAIGASSANILSQFLIEAIILSLGGGFIGTAIGASGAFIIGLVTPIKPLLQPEAILLATAVSGSIGLIFGVAPAQQAAKLDPITALRR